jgi:cobalamin biosynthesis protein CobD/CbiB
VIAVLPLTLLATAFSWAPYVGWIVEILALYCALGMRSLGEHVEPVAKALRSDDLEEARKRVSYLVSRQTSELDKTEVARAATESVLENGSDAVFAAIVLVCRGRCAGRGALPFEQHAGCDVGLSQRTLRAFRLGGGEDRRRAQLHSSASGGVDLRAAG